MAGLHRSPLICLCFQDSLATFGSVEDSFSPLIIQALSTLSGQIPKTLIELHFLAVFSVTYNNLSGRTPEMKQQFGTFSEISYEGNPFLCGLPLDKKCTSIDDLPLMPQKSSSISDGKWYEVDQVVFYASFQYHTSCSF